MGLSSIHIQNIEILLKDSLRYKFEHYNPEPAAMPFFTRLLGEDRLALYKFIHSLIGNFGTSVFEPVAIEIAKRNFKVAKTHVKVGAEISDEAHKAIQGIMDNLSTAQNSPDKLIEIETIRKVCRKGKMKKVKPTVVDVWLESKESELFLFDIKTAKPNAGGFKEFKRTLLEWVAAVLAENPRTKINTLIAIPYNPYEPKPYSRWTMRGMLDLKNELKVAEEFWDFLGGQGSYQQLLDIFETVGVELRPEIDAYFAKYNQDKK